MAALRSTTTKCTRGRGCHGHPAFPTPSLGRRFINASGALRGEGVNVCLKIERRHSGAMRSIEPGISRFPDVHCTSEVWSCGPSRNDGSQPNWLFEKLNREFVGWAKRERAHHHCQVKEREGGHAAIAHLPTRVQSNKLDTDSSDAVRPMASAISGAIESVRMLGALRTASVGWI